MNQVYLITGSNTGDRLLNLSRARELIVKKTGNLIRLSHIYESESWGYASVHPFYNQCYHLESMLTAEIILDEILSIERAMGRIRSGSSYTDRIIDIDILFYNSEIINTEKLTVPHPKLQERKFVLIPLVEIAGDYIHPVLNKSIKQLLKNCKDRLNVNRLDLH